MGYFGSGFRDSDFSLDIEGEFIDRVIARQDPIEVIVNDLLAGVDIFEQQLKIIDARLTIASTILDHRWWLPPKLKNDVLALIAVGAGPKFFAGEEAMLRKYDEGKLAARIKGEPEPAPPEPVWDIKVRFTSPIRSHDDVEYVKKKVGTTIRNAMEGEDWSIDNTSIEVSKINYQDYI